MIAVVVAFAWKYVGYNFVFLLSALQAIFADKVSVQQGLDDAVARGDAVLRRFEATYKGRTLP